MLFHKLVDYLFDTPLNAGNLMGRRLPTILLKIFSNIPGIDPLTVPLAISRSHLFHYTSDYIP